jgi:hypothetical protein
LKTLSAIVSWSARHFRGACFDWFFRLWLNV